MKTCGRDGVMHEHQNRCVRGEHDDFVCSFVYFCTDSTSRAYGMVACDRAIPEMVQFRRGKMPKKGVVLHTNVLQFDIFSWVYFYNIISKVKRILREEHFPFWKSIGLGNLRCTRFGDYGTCRKN